MKYPNLTRNPIADAIVEIKLGFSDEYTSEKFLPFYELIKERFPQKNELVQVSAKINEISEPTVEKKSYGYVFSSADKNKVLHTRHNAFSLSYLNKTYENWEGLWKELSELSELFERNYQAEITGLSIRFINELQIPLNGSGEVEDLSEYLKLKPQIPDGIESTLSDFFMQIFLKDGDKTASITQTINPVRTDYLPLIFDLSAEKQIKGKSELKTCAEEIREFKNRIFFNSLTEKMLNTLK